MMKDGVTKSDARRFAEEAMKRRPEAVSIDQIVYLDEDLHTYKYFMTGNFDAEARARDIAAQAARAQAAGSEEGSDREASQEPNDASGSFYNKLVALNDKIGVF